MSNHRPTSEIPDIALKLDRMAKAIKKVNGLAIAELISKAEPGTEIEATAVAQKVGATFNATTNILRLLKEAGMLQTRRGGAGKKGNFATITVTESPFRDLL